MYRQLKIAVAALVLAVSAVNFAHADEAKVRQVIAAKFPQMVVESVTKTPFGGLYEVVLSGEVVYTDIKGEFLFGGALYDIRSLPPRNLTQETTNKLVAKALTSSHDSAIRMVRGNGRRVIYTFEDPNCGYCKELYKELNKMNDVTVYTFLLPILSPDSAEKSRAIWCSKDRAKAWEQMMTKGVLSEPARTCDTPLEKNAQIAQRFNIRGTPAIYMANGQQLGGYVPAAQIEQALSKTK